jgi:hypothetical protein
LANCTSFPNGSYDCGKCQPGYTGDGVTCTGISTFSLSLSLSLFLFLFATTSCQMGIGYVGDEVTSFLYLCTNLTYFVGMNECDTNNGGCGNSTPCSPFSFSFSLSLLLSFLFPSISLSFSFSFLLFLFPSLSLSLPFSFFGYVPLH